MPERVGCVAIGTLNTEEKEKEKNEETWMDCEFLLLGAFGVDATGFD